MQIQKYIYSMVFCFFLITSGHVSAAILGFDFSQGGYAEGAHVMGMFYGEDLNADSQLSSFDGEITGFMMGFSGNSIVSAFSLGFADLFGLVYDLDGGPLGDGLLLDIEGIGADASPFSYDAGPGPVALCDGVAICGIVDDGAGFDGTTDIVHVSPKTVPEPLSLVLIGIGLTGLGLIRKKI